MAELSTRLLSLVPPPLESSSHSAGAIPADAGLADVVTLQRRREAEIRDGDEDGFFADTLLEYQWARDVAGLAPSTLDKLIKPVIEVAGYYGLPAWRLTPRQMDKYFAGPGKRAPATVRQKLNRIDGYFAFLEQRYRGELARRFGVAVESPVDPFNRPRHRGDFGLRVPPSARDLREFFGSWRQSLPGARKAAVACRNYTMAKVAYLSGVRAAELCPVKIREVNWESGQWGRFLVHGKGANGSGPREREAYLFSEGRELLWWYIEEIRGLFTDDPEHPEAPLWPSERLPAAVEALNLPVAPAVVPSTFRKALQFASLEYLPGPVRELYPHLLRHACATHNYEAGMSLWEVQKLLGHSWTTTTVRYISTAHADPELTSRESSNRAAQRLLMDKGNLR